MILSNPLTFLSLPVTHLLGSTKTWACNYLRVTCINDRDKNNLKNGFHVRYVASKDVTRSLNVSQEQVEPREPPYSTVTIDRVFAYIQSDVMITGTISKKNS